MRPAAFYLPWLLLQSARGVSAPRIADTIPLTPQIVPEDRTSSSILPLERAPYEKQPHGAAAMLDEEARFDCECLH